MYMGPELLFEYRYSTMLNTVFISLMYGTGMPVLYLFAFISFSLTYWVDKWTFLRIYQTPPRYNKQLMQTSRTWIDAAIIIHFLAAFWMYSNSVIFETSDSSTLGIDVSSSTSSVDEDYPWLKLQDRLSQEHSLLYLVFFVIFIVIMLIKVFLLGTIGKLLKCCCSGQNKLLKLIEGEDAVFSTNYYT